MAISSLFGAAASLLYAVSSFMSGVQNHDPVQRTNLIQDFEHENSSANVETGINFLNASSSNSSAIISSANYSAKFTTGSPNLSFRPAISPYHVNASEPTINVTHHSVDLYTLFPNLTASIRAGSGRMISAGPIGVTYYDGETIATVYVRNGNVTHCELLEVNHPEEQTAALRMLAQHNQIIEKIGFHGMLNLMRACQLLDITSSSGSDRVSRGGENKVAVGANQDPLNPIDLLVAKKMNMWSMVSGILPGTKWCGLKDIAKNYNDLGTQRELDKCCRSHDLCPRKVLALRSAYGLVNWSFYAKSHCECDNALYDCLKRAAVSSPVAKLVGDFYFNILRTQCIDEEDSTECLQYDLYTCIKWKNDDSEHLKLVFKDVKRQFR